MLIIFPTQVPFNPARLPYLTLCLMIFTTISYFVFQHDDVEEEQAAIEFYQSSGLFNSEIDYFNDYLKTDTALSDYQSLSDFDTQGPARLYYMVFDQSFRHYIESQIQQSPATIETQQWRAMHNELALKKQQVTYFNFGARPDNLMEPGLITHIFLHGGIMHLLGNMVFLLLFGLGVEALYGKAKLLIIYLTSGVVGAIAFNFIDGKSYSALVGASGAISGLMGAYAAYFGTQRIRFFAWFGIYFNQYKWPAAIVLLFWLGKEFFYQLTDLESNTAYMAHFGGLLAGGLLGLLFKNLPFNSQNLESSQADRANSSLGESTSSTNHYQTALEHIRKLEITEARSALNQALENNSGHLQALQSLYNLEKVNPKLNSYHKVINQVFAFDLRNTAADAFILSVAEDSVSKTIGIDQLNIDAFFGLLHRQLRNDRLQASTPLVQQAKKTFSENDKLPKLLFEWSKALAKHNKIRSASIELNYLANYYGETPFGRSARQQLKAWRD